MTLVWLWIPFSLALTAAHPAIKPGVERWPVKTAQPIQVAWMTMGGPSIPIASLLRLPNIPGVRHNDPRYQSARIPLATIGSNDGLALFEGEEITTEAWMWLVAAETDGDLHIQLAATSSSGTPSFIVEIPDPAFVSTSGEFRELINMTRGSVLELMGKGLKPTGAGTVLDPPVHVRVSGALFYDDAHVGTPPRGKKGMTSSTLFEIHPVTRLEEIP